MDTIVIDSKKVELLPFGTEVSVIGILGDIDFQDALVTADKWCELNGYSHDRMIDDEFDRQLNSLVFYVGVKPNS